MLDNFTSGGQILHHKITMFKQVFIRSLVIAIFFSFAFSLLYCKERISKLDVYGALIHYKTTFDFGKYYYWNSKRVKHRVVVDNRVLYLTETQISNHPYFVQARMDLISILKSIAKSTIILTFVLLSIYYSLLRFIGKRLKSKKVIEGTKIFTSSQITRYLYSNSLASNIKIGSMPLVKDTQNRHTIALGTTGSGKTNLLHNIIPQITNQMAIVFDQTGEMVAKYYDEERGDIIFNPLDSRSASWDFFKDVQDDNIEKFSSILFRTKSNADPFWSNSAKVIFDSIVRHQIAADESIESLKYLLFNTDLQELSSILQNTKASRYLSNSNKIVASSILSVLATGAKSLNLLNSSNCTFSLKEYFNVKENTKNPPWLFLASPPHLREVTLPLLSSVFELSISHLMSRQTQCQPLWFIVDELATLGHLNSLPVALAEARKYNGCVLAATQSVNQIFENFGPRLGSTIFGLFATKFIFRTDEPSACRLISDIFGYQEIQNQQKNTSFGANEYRDGISYQEVHRQKPIITTDMLASLKDLECFVGLPNPNIRLARINVPLANITNKQEGFKPIDSTDSKVRNNIPTNDSIKEIQCENTLEDTLSLKI